MSSTQIISPWTCQGCKATFSSPVMLPCGHSLCKSHVISAIDNITCPICLKEHAIPPNGFINNLTLQQLLNANIQNLDIDKFESRREVKQSCQRLKNKWVELQRLHESPARYVAEYADAEVNKIDIKREQEIEILDKYYGGLIDQIRAFQKECLEAAKAPQKSDVDAEKCNQLISTSEAQFESLVVDEAHWRLIKQQCNESRVNIEQSLTKAKNSIMLNKVHVFDGDYTFVDGNKRKYFGIIWQSDRLLSRIITTNVSEFLDMCGFTSCKAHFFPLLYRASEHGFGAADFHTKCDNLLNTLTIIKTTRGDIFGGYTTQKWDGCSQYKQDANAFLFSFNQEQSTTPPKQKFTCRDYSKAMFGGPNYGPCFGSTDIVITANSNEAKKSSSALCSYIYPSGCLLTAETNFQTVEIEVFQVL